MRSKFILFFAFVVATACKKETAEVEAVEAPPITVQVERFEQAFFESSRNELPELKQKFPEFFPKGVPDEVWIEKMEHPQWRELYAEVQKQHGDFSKSKAELEKLFANIRHFFPDTRIPKVVTLIGDMDYTAKTIYADSLALVALELYLGKNHRFYTDPKYLTVNYEPRQIAPDMAESFMFGKIPPLGEDLISKMVYWGKMLYAKDVLLNGFTDAEKIGYTPEQLAWSKENEAYIWRYFVDEQLLYSTDPKLENRFINPGPFSKFYLEIDNESPGRIGQYMGWQIVRSYMENNETRFQDMLKLDARTLFEKSKYKPSKNAE